MTARSGDYAPDILLAEYERLEERCVHEAGRAGRTTVLGWDLEYTSPTALLTFVDQILFRRMNDFTAETDRPVIIDCGANIGYTALHYRRCYPHARITAFEPDPQFLPLLRANLERNGAADVTIVPAAAWVSDGQSTWVMEGTDGSRLSDGMPGRETVTVATVDLRKHLTKDVDLLKLDIEGAEFEVVPHIAGRLGHVRNIIIECHLVDQTKYDALASIMTALTGAGFRISVNSWGPWRDLTRRHTSDALHAEQYLTVYGWRRDHAALSTDPTHLPYVGIEHYRRTAGLSGMKRYQEDVGRAIARLVESSSCVVTHRIGDAFGKEQGHCWYARLPESFPAGDSLEDAATTTVVLEGDRALGPGHATHDDIRYKGRGLYSHWGPWLYLSASDNSDPNTNGRVYTVISIRRS